MDVPMILASELTCRPLAAVMPLFGMPVKKASLLLSMNVKISRANIEGTL